MRSFFFSLFGGFSFFRGFSTAGFPQFLLFLFLLSFLFSGYLGLCRGSWETKFMRVLAWNYRGINRASTVRALKVIIDVHNPNCIFLSETKASVERMEFVRKSLDFVGFKCVPANGKAGGLCFLWRKGVSMDVLVTNKNLIGVDFKGNGSEGQWFLICVYGPAHGWQKDNFWLQLEEVTKN